MRRNLFLLAALCLPFAARPQGNFPFPTTNTQWVMTSVYALIGPNETYYVSKYWVDGDTVLVNDTAYVKVYAQKLCFDNAYPAEPYQPAQQPNAAVVGGIRTETNKVYFRRFPFPPNFFTAYGQVGRFPLDTDRMLYDFTLQTGDTIRYIENDSFIVKETSFTPDGRKKMVLKNLSGIPYETRWVEGLGADWGLFETNYIWHYWENCVNVDGQTFCPVPCTPFPPQFITPVADVAQALQCSVTPSPASSTLRVQVDDAGRPFNLEIYSLQGQRLAQLPACLPGQEISVQAFPAGMLLFRLNTSDGRSAWVKVLKQ